jgi:type I restriction enzyme S subunit
MKTLGSGVIQTLSFTHIANSELVFPPLNEQADIAQFLDEKTTKIEQAIALKEQQIALLKERKQIVIHKAVTRGLDETVAFKDSGVTWIGDIPKHWEVKPLRHIGKTQNGLSKGGEYFGSGYPFLSYGDVYNNRTIPIKLSGLVNTSSEERKQFSIKEGDIFFTRTSETVDDIGFSSTSFYTETISKKIDKAISLKQQEIEKLKEYKSSLINSVVTGKIRVLSLSK